MDIPYISPETHLQNASPPFPQNTEDQEQELTTRQRKVNEDDMARLPRIPRVTADCPQPMTLDQMNDWKDQYQMKRRPPTKSERDDYSECDRQFNDAASATTIDWEDDEEYMDTCPSPTQRSCAAWTPEYQARRDGRKRPLSPPRTPPHLRGSKLYKYRGPISVLQPEKNKRHSRVATRSTITRTYGTPAISLHHRKGYVKYWHVPWKYVVITYEQYLKDYNREELDKHPPESVDFSDEHPGIPRKTPYQREVCRRAKAQDVMLRNAVKVPLFYKGHQ